MIDLKKLRELAMAATPGPWKYVHLSGDKRNDGSTWGANGLWTFDNKMILGNGDGWDGEFEEPSKNDAAFIAEANPKVILELLDLIKELQDKATTHLKYEE